MEENNVDNNILSSNDINVSDYIKRVKKNFPHEIQDIPHWHLYKSYDKSPCVEINGNLVDGSSTDPTKWTDFIAACNQYEKWKDVVGGLGFSFDGSENITFIDLDDCLEIDGKKVNNLRYNDTIKINSYTEASPSKTGLHIFVKTSEPLMIAGNGIEIYQKGRYCTVTGYKYQETPVEINGNWEAVKILYDEAIANISSGKKKNINKLSGKIGTGGRNKALVSLAGTLHRRSLSRDVIIASLLKFNEVQCDPPIEDIEIEKIVNSILKYDSDDPIITTTIKSGVDVDDVLSNKTDVEPEITEESKNILKNGDPIKYLLDVYQKIHVGDIEIGELLIATIGSTIVANSHGIHPGLNGTSGKGKSNACMAIAHLVPDEFKFVGSSSPKGLLFSNLSEGTVIFLDDIGQLNEDMESIIKRTTSMFQEPFVHIFTDLRIKNDNKTRKAIIPPRCTWWITSHDANFDAQILNRQLMLAVVETNDQDAAVMKRQLEDAEIGRYELEITRDVKICREIIRLIKKEIVNVKIPFATKIKWYNASNRRNLPMFLDTIKSFAAIRRCQRVKDNDGFIVATIDDYERAVKLWSYCQEEQISKLTKAEINILTIIQKRGDRGIVKSDLINESGLSSSRISEILNGKKRKDGSQAGGLLQKVSGLVSVRESTRNDCTNVTQIRYISKSSSFDRIGNYSSIVSISE
jgi:primase-polymerase (primpol)-like protein